MVKARDLIKSFNPSQYSSQMDGVIKSFLSGDPSFDASPDVVNNYIDKAVRAPALRSYDRDIAPRIADQFAAHGATFSTARGRVGAQTLGDIQSNIDAQAAQANMQALNLRAQLAEAAKGRQAQGIGFALQQQQLPLAYSGLIQQLASPYQAQQQAQLDTQFEEFNRTQTYNSPYLGLALNAINSQQTYAYQPKPSAWLGAGVTGAAGALYGAAGGFGSIGTGAAFSGLFGGTAAAATTGATTAAATGAATAGGGAAAGAAAGSAFPVIGTAIGALLGAGLGYYSASR